MDFDAVRRFQHRFFKDHFIKPSVVNTHFHHLQHCHRHREQYENALEVWNESGNNTSPPLMTPCRWRRTGKTKRAIIIDCLTAYQFENEEYRCSRDSKSKMWIFGGVRHDYKLLQASVDDAFKGQQSVFLSATPSPLLYITQTIGITFQLAVSMHYLTEVTKKVSSACMFMQCLQLCL